jgi:aspartate kinase
VRDGLTAKFGARARLLDGLGPVSAIGAGINATYANVRIGNEALHGIGVTPLGVATSSFRITWMIPRDRIPEAVRTLHRRFIEVPRPLLP